MRFRITSGSSYGTGAVPVRCTRNAPPGAGSPRPIYARR
jgi:hypothetical protein